jgi:exopolysaccharide biosynthesis polyprenyl glycosylphosphotransferase
MLGKRRPAWVLCLMALDVATLVIAFLVAFQVRVLLDAPLVRAAGPFQSYLWLLLPIVPVWIALVGLMHGYNLRWLTSSRARLAFRVSGVGLVLLSAGLFLSKDVRVNRSLLILFAAAGGLGLWAERELVRAWLRRRQRDGRWLRHALVVGTGADAAEVVAALGRYPEAGWSVRGCLGLERSASRQSVAGVAVVGSLEDLSALLEGNEVVDEVFFAVPPDHLGRVTDALEVCETYGLDTRVLMQPRATVRADPFAEQLFGLPFYGLSRRLNRPWALAAKRTADLVGALALLVATLPLLAVVGLLVRLTSPGPSLFHQERVGLHGRRFRMYKFRTMVPGAEGMRDQVAHLNQMAGPVFKAADDPRLTSLGRFLRRTSLDELPQLFNVLRGEMSLVGPRPLPVCEVSLIKGAQRRRLAMRPGITGLWQVSGRNQLDFDTWMCLDLEYVDQWSLGLDLRILFWTIPAVLAGRGAY